MVIVHKNRKNYVWMFLLLLVLGANLLLYRSPITPIVLTDEMKWVIFGSLFDLAIVIPVLLLLFYGKKTITLKRFIFFMAGGLILARFLIPEQYFSPFVGITYVGFAIEGSLIVFELIVFIMELILLYILIRNIPSIIREVRASTLSPLFSFPIIVKEKVRNLPIIHILVSEILMFYYAFAAWRKHPTTGKNMFTLYKNSSVIAFHILLIHSVIIETFAIHWWLHNKVLWLSILLFIFNIYTVLFLIANIQVIRLNPVKIVDNCLYLSLGLGKKMIVNVNDISTIITDKVKLEEKINKQTTIDFIAKDLEEVFPQMILELKKPCKATLFLGFEKSYEKIALRLDDPTSFQQLLRKYMDG